MILFCDEDIGTRVPDALRLVGYETFSMSQKGWLSRPDTDWLAFAGKQRWLVFSSNKKMLKVPEERRCIVDNKVGIVFLSNGEENLAKVLWLLLVKWTWLERIDRTLPRPFAFVLTPQGRIRQESLA